MAIMKKLAALAVVFCLPAVAASGQTVAAAAARVAPEHAYGRSQGPVQTDSFSQVFKTGPSGVLDLTNISGEITVTGGPGDAISVAAVKKARDRGGRTARQQLDMVTIEATERSGRVEVRARYPKNERNFNVSIDFTVKVPTRATVLLRSVSGNITVRSVAGDLVRAETVSGNATASDTGRTVFLKSVSGNVEAVNVAEGGEITMHTVAGIASARNLRCQSFDGNTVSGDVRLIDSECKRVSVQSVTGAVEYTGSLAAGGRYELKSHSGDIRLALGPDAGFEIDANTFSGTLKSDLPLTVRSTGDENRGGVRRTLRGTYGNAEAFLDLTTFSGNVVIVRK